MSIESPCIGNCKLDNGAPQTCQGCLRTIDEIVQWPSYTQSEKERVLACLPERRYRSNRIRCYTDQIGRQLYLEETCSAIVSLVPSITQTLYDFGLGHRVVGVTGYCPQDPKGEPIPVVGGTKNVRISRVRSLKPKLVIANKEENSKADIHELEQEFPVFVSDVTTLAESLHLIESLGTILNCRLVAQEWSQKINSKLPQIQGRFEGKIAYLIWQNPYMTVGQDTFIHHWLKHLGFENVFQGENRYPETSIKQLIERSPQYVFLPDEPYKFSEEDRQFLASRLPKSQVFRVPGHHFTWHGTSMLRALEFFDRLLQEILQEHCMPSDLF